MDWKRRLLKSLMGEWGASKKEINPKSKKTNPTTSLPVFKRTMTFKRENFQGTEMLHWFDPSLT